MENVPISTALTTTLPGTTSDVVNEIDAKFIEFICRSVVVCFIAVIAIVGNFLNFVVIRKLSDVNMGEASKIFYLALSVADFITGLVLFIAKLTDDRIIRDGTGILCKVVGFVMTCAPGTSAIFILLANTDRFFAITRPLVYHTVVTRRRAIIAVAFSAVYVCLAMFIFAFIHGNVIRYHASLGICKIAFWDHSFLPYTLASFSLNMWPVAILLAIMYAKIINISFKHASRVRAHQKIAQRLQQANQENIVRHNIGVSSAEINGNNDRIFEKFKGRFERNLRTLRTPILITGFYLLAWIPFSVMETFISVTQRTELLESPPYTIFASIAACNCSVNLCVYYVSREDFRRVLKKLFLNRH